MVFRIYLLGFLDLSIMIFGIIHYDFFGIIHYDFCLCL